MAREHQELYRKRVAIPHAVGPDVQMASSASNQKEIAARTQSLATLPGTLRQNFLLAVLFLLAGGLVIRRLAPEITDYINQQFNPWVLAPATAANFSAKIRAEDEAFSEFLLAFRTGPAVTATAAPLGGDSSAQPLKEFFARAPKTIGAFRKLLQEIGGATDSATRQKMFSDLRRDMRSLKGEAGLSELLPVWQMASALEGLLKQLTDRVVNVSPSTIRTVAGGVELLDKLCKPGVQADLLTSPPLRLLAVDDDLISRNAVSHALKKALNLPDLAENGEAALALATEHAYDVIFLDVQMPGMDGFEVCTRIHDTVPNRTTPVVFVTNQSDFDARAQATLSGGTDLIGKPFLTFEITVKALTLALQGRLEGRAEIAGGHNAINGSTSLSPVVSPLERTTVPLLGGGRGGFTGKGNGTVQESNEVTAKTDLAEMFTDDQRQGRLLTGRNGSGVPPNEDGSNSSGELSPEQLTRLSAHIGPLRELIEAIFQTADVNTRQDMLAHFFLRFNSLAPKGDSAAGHPALRMSAALEGLLKKLLENSKHCTSSTILTIATAVDLLHDLCATTVKADMITTHPIHILVVDDDPVARRALTCALQMAFEKPESVDNGEAALAVATERPFDMIFLDVLMPGIDGFTACLRIHETVQNRNTPVVFVTSQSDFKARSQATVSGGSDLMGKPFLTAEVTVKALTFALRGRLQKLKVAHNVMHLPSEAGQEQSDLIPAPPESTSDRDEPRSRSRRSNQSRKQERHRSGSAQAALEEKTSRQVLPPRRPMTHASALARRSGG